MKKQIGLLLLLGAIAAGLLTFLIAIFRQPTVDTIRVLAARTYLPAGHTLVFDDLAWTQVPRPKLPRQLRNYVRATDKISDILGSDLRKSVKRAQPILKSNLILLKGGYYAKLLPKGYRAYPIPMSRSISSLQLIQPDDRVNFLMTYVKNKVVVTQTILKGIRVIAIAPPYPTSKKDEKSSLKSRKNTRARHSMVLMMTPKQVKTLILAQKMGDVSFTLISARTGKQYGRYPLTNDILTGPQIDRYRLREVTVYRGLHKKTDAFNPKRKK